MKDTIGTVDFALLRDCVILGPRMAVPLRFFCFQRFCRKNGFNEICKETIEIDLPL